jgi:hypothetical protein
MEGLEMTRLRLVGRNLSLVLFGGTIGIAGLLCARTSSAQTSELIRFYDQSPHDGIVPVENLRLVNGTSSKKCAMIYVLDRIAQLQESCGCPLSPSKEVRISLSPGLTSNQNFGSVVLSTGQITIFSTAPNGGDSEFAKGGCDPAANFAPVRPVSAPPAGVTAWMEYTTTAVTEANDPFIAVPFDLEVASDFITADAILGSNSGSFGRGICSCGND